MSQHSRRTYQRAQGRTADRTDVGVSGRLLHVIEPLYDDLPVSGWLTLPEVAEHMGVEVTRVRQLLRERALVAVRRGERNVLCVPADLLTDGTPIKGLAGTLTLLHDAGYGDVEAVRWLYRPDASLPGTPVQALRENRGTEVKRRAQAAGF